MSDSREVFIIAGEHSGDLIGEMLIRELLALEPEITVTGLGGERMESAGARILTNMVSDLAIVGLVEVISKFPKIYKVFFGTLDYLREHRPSLLVLIDYPGFNLRLAERVRKLGIPILYYVTPQVWAWHRSRLKKMRRVIDKALVILPFEEPLLRDAGIPTRFVGTPWLDLMVLTMNREEVFSHFELDPGKKLIGLLPGSRNSEIENLLPIMIDAAAKIRAEREDVQFVLVRSSSIDREVIARHLASAEVPVKVIDSYRYNVRNAMDLVIVASGTATLETGLLLCPMIIIYRAPQWTWEIGKRLVRLRFLGLINIVADEAVVPELLQKDCTPENIAERSLRILNDPDEVARIQAGLSRVKDLMGGPGASRRVAAIIQNMIGGEETREITNENASPPHV